MPKVTFDPLPRRNPDRHAVTHASESLVVTTQRINPQCTHITMDRLRGDFLCDNCNRPSDHRWLYICTQDVDFHTQEEMLATIRASTATMTGFDDDESELHALGVSKPIIEQWRLGAYDDEQIARIKDQKLHVVHAMETSNVVRCAPHYASYSPAKALVPDSTVPDDTNSYQVGGTTIMPATSSMPTPVSICHYKCCHRCRPYYRDRLPMSIDAVIEDTHELVTAGEMPYLPIMDAEIARNFGTAWSRGQQPTPADTVKGNENGSPSAIRAATINLRYSPVGTAVSVASSFDSHSDDIDGEDELQFRLRKLVTGSQYQLPGQNSPRYDLPLRQKPSPCSPARSDSESAESCSFSGFNSPTGSQAASFTSATSAVTDPSSDSSPIMGLGLSFLPTCFRHSSPALSKRGEMFVTRDNTSMESLGLGDDMVMIAV